MRALACGLLVILPLAACGSGEPDIAPKDQAVRPADSCCVIDAADVLSRAEEAHLNAVSASIRSATRAQVAVKTVPNLGGQSIEQYALAEAKRLGVGDAERDDGVLIVLAPKDRRVRIEVGLGPERVLSNAACKTIIEEAMLPAFKVGNFAKGIEAGMKRINGVLAAAANDNAPSDIKAVAS